MKRSFIIGSLILFSNITLWCQVHFDVYAGVSPGSQSGSRSILVNRESPDDEFQMALQQTKPQVQAGVKGNVSLNESFFAEAGLIYAHTENIFQADYTVYSRTDEIKPAQFQQRRHQLMLPVNIGIGLGAFEVTSGLRISKTIAESNDFALVEGFSSACDGMSMGWQAGVRCNVGGVLIGVEYMADMERVGEGLSINTSSLALNHVPGNFVFTLQYRM